MGEGSRRNRAQRVCTSLHRLLSCVDRAWGKLRRSCKRRRNSQKRVIFYGSQAVANLFVMICAMVLYQLILATATTVGQTCGSDPVPTNDTDLKNETLTNSIAFECANDAFGLSACEYSDLLDVGNMMYANFYVNGLQFLVSLIIIYCLSKFTQMPAEKLQFDKRNASRLMMLYGGICKQGPWLSRLLHFVQGILLFGSWLMMIMGYCRGNLAMTTYCTAYNEKCAYNKARNCQYYYVYCKPDATQLTTCMTETGRAAFSGRMDIRLLSEVHCVACGILEADFQNTMGEDEFYLLDESSRGTDAWFCNEQLVGRGCFHTIAWTSIKCGTTTTGGSCEASLGGVVTADYLSGTIAGLVCPTRRLDEMPDAWQPPEQERRKLQGDSSDELQVSQQCSWGPAILGYAFDSTQCSQTGSLVYRLSMLYIYFAGCIYAVFTILGQIVRLMLNPEPWFFNPQTPDENMIFRFLRKVAP